MNDAKRARCAARADSQKKLGSGLSGLPPSGERPTVTLATFLPHWYRLWYYDAMAQRKPSRRTMAAFKKATLLIPLLYNDGSTIPKEVLLDIKDELFAAFGGWTDEGTVQGAYRMATGQRIVERHHKLVAVVPERDVPKLRAMAARWCTILEQEALFVEIADSLVEFVKPESEEERS